MNHNVGDILWIVTKEIIKKTLKGEQKIYTVDLARGPKVVKVNLDKIKGNIYNSSNDAKAAMLEDAEGAIDALIKYNNNSLEKYFTLSIKKDRPVEIKKINDNYDYEIIELENGQKAKVKIPKELKNAGKNN